MDKILLKNKKVFTCKNFNGYFYIKNKKVFTCKKFNGYFYIKNKGFLHIKFLMNIIEK